MRVWLWVVCVMGVWHWGVVVRVCLNCVRTYVLGLGSLPWTASTLTEMFRIWVVLLLMMR